MDIVNRDNTGLNLNQETNGSIFNKSETAFLIEPCEALSRVTDKPYYVDKWDFSTTHSVAIHSKLSIGFSRVAESHKHAIQDALHVFIHTYKAKEKSFPSVAAIRRWKVGLQRVALLMGGFEWKSLDRRSTYKLFQNRISKSHYSDGSVQSIVTVLNKLRAVKLIERVVYGSKLQALVSDKKIEQAIAIPIRLYQTLVSESLKIVEAYYEHRHAISDVMKVAYDTKATLESSVSRGTIIRKVRKFPHQIPDFKVDFPGLALGRIQVACIIVLLAFSGVRFGEACSFNKNSVTEINVNGNKVAILKGETSKGEDGILKERVWQSHPITKKALLLADDMMSSTRSLYELDINSKEASGEYTEGDIEHMRKQLTSAFLITGAALQSSNNYIANALDRRILAFFKSLNITANGDDVAEFDLLNPQREGQLKLNGFLPKLSPHDFRRTFAVFFVRYGFGTPSGIKFQYGHGNLNMANYYANNAVLASMNDVLMDKDLLKELEDARIDLGIDLYDDIYNKTEYLSGVQGEVIQQNKVEKLKQGIDVYMTRKEIEIHVRSGDFSIIQLPTGGYCTNDSCDRVCGIHSFKSEIKPCSHQVFTDQGAKKLAKQRDRLIETFNDLNEGDHLKRGILSGLKQKIQISEKTLEKHEINFTPFNEKIFILEKVK